MFSDSALTPELFPGAGLGGQLRGHGRVCWEESRGGEAIIGGGKGAYWSFDFPDKGFLPPGGLPLHQDSEAYQPPTWRSVNGAAGGFCHSSLLHPKPQPASPILLTSGICRNSPSIVLPLVGV